ncbi:MAG: methyltransferase [Nitrososphaera sp.]|nr:methyltransferase [Nitrososphaera sp.]
MGNSVPADFEASALRRLGFITQDVGLYRSAIQVWRDAEGLIVITDRPDYRLPDRVFPIFSDENIVLVDYLKVTTPKSVVIDIGTGSGILALAAARRGAHVHAVDISARALNFSVFNAVMNELRSSVAFYLGDAFAPITAPTCDLIVSNPPFVPLPSRCPFHTAGRGGIDGTSVIRKVLLGSRRYLRQGATLVMTTLSLQRDGVPFVLELAEQLLEGMLPLATVPIYSDVLPLSTFYEVVGRWDADGSWYETLIENRFSELSYFVLVAGASAERIVGTVEPRQLGQTTFSGSWQGRLNRYRFWLEPMGQ